MSSYGKCRYCDYCDSSETNGYKWYCNWYKIYVDPDNYEECPHYRD